MECSNDCHKVKFSPVRIKRKARLSRRSSIVLYGQIKFGTCSFTFSSAIGQTTVLVAHTNGWELPLASKMAWAWTINVKCDYFDRRDSDKGGKSDVGEILSNGVCMVIPDTMRIEDESDGFCINRFTLSSVDFLFKFRTRKLLGVTKNRAN